MSIARIDKNDRSRTQTLKEHSANVAVIASAAAEQVGLPNLAKLAGFLHDAGKTKPGFQDYIMEEDESKQKALHGKVIHSRAGALFLHYLLSQSDINGKMASGWAKDLTEEIIDMAIVSHHTGLIDPFTVEGQNNLERAMYQCEDEDLAVADAFFDEVISKDEVLKLFNAAVGEVERICGGESLRSIQMKYKNNKESRNCYGLSLRSFLVEYIASCIVEGDRLDAQCFEEHRVVTPDEMKSKGDWSDYLDALEQRISKFSADGKINRLRAKLSENCKASATGKAGIYTLWAPTGFGKTLASLRFSLGQAIKTDASHVFYIIPYMSIIDQTASEFKSFLPKEVILEHHSNVNTEQYSDDELKSYELATQSWTNPIVMTTMVQFLDTVFSMQNTNIRRFHSLANSIIIFDEIQSLPTHCMLPFFQTCEFLASVCHCTIVLCSATQPKFNDAGLYLQLLSDGDIGGLTNADAEAMRRTEIVDIRNRGKLDAEALTDFVLEQDARSVLIVHNTRKAAQATYDSLLKKTSAGVKVFFLTTDLCPKHRLQIIDTVKSILNNSEGERVFIVSTQLIEAGVDISVDMAFRSLAGLDCIIQTAGRCNRHGLSAIRPVYVFESADENLSHLTDIKEAQQDYTNTFEYCRAKGLSLMEQEAIAYYYSVRNQRFRNDTYRNGYPIKMEGIRTTVTELFYPSAGNFIYKLAKNTVGQAVARSISCTPFRSIGESFHVIDNANQVSVIVPFDDDARTLIDELQNDYLYPSEKNHLLKTAQQYTVNTFIPMNGSIPDNIIQKDGLWFAIEYDLSTGLRLKKADGSAIIL